MWFISRNRLTCFLAVWLLIAAAQAQNAVSLDQNVKGSKWPAAATDTGTANAYAVTGIPLAPSLRTYSVIIFKAAHANTGASTLSVNGGSTIAIKKNGSSALVGGEIPANGIVTVIYDGTNFQMLTATSTGTGTGNTIHTCIIPTGDPGATSPALADDNDAPGVCGNDFGADETITAFAACADAGSPVVNPILSGGSSTSILTGSVTVTGTCPTPGNAGTWTAGTINGSPVIHSFNSDGATCPSTPCTIDDNISTAGGTAKLILFKLTVVGPGGTGSTTVGTGGATNHQPLFDDAGLVNGIPLGASGTVLTSNGTSSTPSFQSVSSLGIVTSFSGDGTLISNSSSTGAVTATLANAGAHKYWGNNTTSTAAPNYYQPADADISFTDITTGNSATTQHGFLKKLDNNAGHFMDGTGNWSTPSGTGGLPTSESHTASSSAELDFTTCITGSYTHYELIITNLVPGTNAVSVNFQASTNGGSTYDTTSGHYGYSTFRFISSGSAAGGSDSTTAIGIDGGATVDTLSSTASNGGLNGTYDLFNPGSSTEKKMLKGVTSFFNTASHYEGATVSGSYTQTTAVNAFRIIPSSGNLASGTVTCQPLPY